MLTFKAGGTDLVTSVVWDSAGANQTCTRLGIKNYGANYNLYQYYFVGPTPGSSKNITITLSAAANFIFSGAAASYTGVSQSGYPDAQSNGSAVTNADIVGTVTTVADNSWPVMVAGTDDQVSGAGAGTTIRVQPTGNRSAVGDSNAPKTPAGSISLTFTCSIGTTASGYIIASMAPAGGGGGGTVRDARLLALLGVG